jgi:hypothetical protein
MASFTTALGIISPRFATHILTCTFPRAASPHTLRVGHDHSHVRCINGILGREITKYTVIYGAFVRFWPTLHTLHHCLCRYTVLANHTHSPSLPVPIYGSGQSYTLSILPMYALPITALSMNNSGQPYTLSTTAYVESGQSYTLSILPMYTLSITALSMYNSGQPYTLSTTACVEHICRRRCEPQQRRC